ASVLLLTGRLAEGWQDYEWRWQTRHLAGDARRFAAPLWNGEPIGDGVVILLHAEQGLGDTLQFCRYVPLVGAGARVVLEVQAPLARLLSRLPGVATLVARGDRLPPFDLHCPLLSLPRALGTTLDTIPGATPYLTADPALAARPRRQPLVSAAAPVPPARPRRLGQRDPRGPRQPAAAGRRRSRSAAIRLATAATPAAAGRDRTATDRPSARRRRRSARP